MPIWCLGLGAVVSAAQAAGGHAAAAALTAAIFVVAAGAFALAERSDTLAGLGGTQGDERFEGTERASMAIAGRAMAIAVIAGWVVELIRGNDGVEYAWILGVGTLAYLAAMVSLRRVR